MVDKPMSLAKARKGSNSGMGQCVHKQRKLTTAMANNQLPTTFFYLVPFGFY
jgi:hypothetical protein